MSDYCAKPELELLVKIDDESATESECCTDVTDDDMSKCADSISVRANEVIGNNDVVEKLAEAKRNDDLFYVVDDDSLIVRAHARFLQAFLRKHENVQIKTFENGAAAIAEIEATGKAPCLIVSDVDMPKLKGDEMCEKLKAIPQAHRPFVVLITGRDIKKCRDSFKEAGATASMQKPLDISDFRGVVNLVLEQLKKDKK